MILDVIVFKKISFFGRGRERDPFVDTMYMFYIYTHEMWMMRWWETLSVTMFGLLVVVFCFTLQGTHKPLLFHRLDGWEEPKNSLFLVFFIILWRRHVVQALGHFLSCFRLELTIFCQQWQSFCQQPLKTTEVEDQLISKNVEKQKTQS